MYEPTPTTNNQEKRKKVNDLEKDDGTLKKIARNNNFLKII